MLGISLWDWVAIAVYLVGITIIGVWTAKKVKDTADFFMAGRRFGKVFMVFFNFGAGTSGNDAVGVSAKTFTNGISGIWYQWLWLFCTPFYWIIAPVFRRMRALTTGDYFDARYDGSVAGLYTVVGILQLTVNIGVVSLGAGSMIEALTGGALNRYVGIFVMTILYVIYGMAGGLGAAIVTDFIQGLLTIVLSFMLLPFALSMVGGFPGLREAIADPHMFSLVAPGEINGFHVTIFAINSLVGIVTQPHIMGVCAAGRNEMDGRVGFAGGNLLKRLCTVAWMLVGLCAVAMPHMAGMDPDLVFGNVAHELLPKVMPGLIGLFLAALLASVMSSCDAFMVSTSGLFTQNLYRRYFVRGRHDSHYVFVGRVASLIVVVCSILFAVLVPNVPSGLEWFFRLQAMMGAAFWLGLFWRRTTVAGAWAATLTSFGVLLVTSLPAFTSWAAAHLPDYMLWDGKFRLSWQMFAYLIGGFSMGIIVSLLTPRVAAARLERFYACLRTPVQENEPHASEPFTLPPGVTPPLPRKLIPHPDLEIPVPTLTGMAGFAFFWACVFALIFFVRWMAAWGA